MLVIERLYPIDYRAYEVEKRELWIDVFKKELKELHQRGFLNKYVEMELQEMEAFKEYFLNR